MEENEELLIDLVRERPWLYDPKNISFKDTRKKERTWAYIDEVLGIEGMYPQVHIEN